MTEKKRVRWSFYNLTRGFSYRATFRSVCVREKKTNFIAL